MQKVLITGGAGFIGSSIVEYLYSLKDYEIVVYDNFSPQIHGDNYKDSFLYRKIHDMCKIINADIRDKEKFEAALEGVEYIIHLASETGTGQSMYELNKYTDTNIMGTSNIFQSLLSKENSVKKIILSSSRSVYGEGMYKCNSHGIVFPESRKNLDMADGDFEAKCPICNEDVTVIATTENCKISPISYYAFTKMSQEKMIELLCKSYNINYTIFRYQNVYGAGQSLNNPYTGILSIFSKLLLANKSINIFEDGEESRDFVHVKDVARVTADALVNEKTNGKCINVGSGERKTVIDVAETLKSLYDSDSNISITGDFREGDIRHNTADISLLKELMDFNLEYTFERGMEEFTKWVKSEFTERTEATDFLYEKSISEMKALGMLHQKSGEQK